MRTLLLDTEAWDIAADALGNIAVASDPYSEAQDAASACRLFAGELYYDTAAGIPYFEEILGHTPPVELLRAYLVRAALTVPGVVGARAFLSAWDDRVVRGQVQITDGSGRTSAANF